MCRAQVSVSYIESSQIGFLFWPSALLESLSADHCLPFVPPEAVPKVPSSEDFQRDVRRTGCTGLLGCRGPESHSESALSFAATRLGSWDAAAARPGAIVTPPAVVEGSGRPARA